MRGIISTDKTELEIINKKINDWMLSNIENYSGQRWGEIKEHPKLKGTYILIINNDSRNPIDRLTVAEKTRYVEQDMNTWVK